MLRGFDVSNWQADMDVSTLPGDFLIIKASEGTSYIDPMRGVHGSRWGAKPVGYYHFLHHGNIQAQANEFHSATSGCHGAVAIIDAERDDVTADDVWQMAQAIHSKCGKWPWVYCSASKVGKYVNDNTRAHCGLWIAGYPSNQTYTAFPDMKFPYTVNGTVCAWQFTSSFHVDGHTIDANVFYGDVDAWNRYAAGAAGNKTYPALSGNGWAAARQILNGDYGNGAERKAALGDKYEWAQAYVGYLMYWSDSKLADYVIKGEMGSGQTRKDILGSRYEGVQAAVNRKLKKGRK